MIAFVYVVQANNGEVKIGVSGTPFARLSQIKKEYGPRRHFSDAYLVGFAVTRYGLAVETCAHGLLEEYAVGGEWYKVNALIALGAVAASARAIDSRAFVYTEGPAEEKVPISVVRKFFKSRLQINASAGAQPVAAADGRGCVKSKGPGSANLP